MADCGLRQGRDPWVQKCVCVWGGGVCGRGVCSPYGSHDAGERGSGLG